MLLIIPRGALFALGRRRDECIVYSRSLACR